MDLVDRHCLLSLAGRMTMHPFVVAPAEGRIGGDDGGRGGRRLACPRHRIGLLRQGIAVAIDDLELVALARPEPRDEELPDAGGGAETHWVTASVPCIEVADDGDAARVRGPDGETDPGDAVHFHGLCAERPGEVVMGALRNQMKVQLAEKEAEGVGVLRLLNRVGPVDAETVSAAAADIGGEEATVENLLHRRDHRTAVGVDHLYRGCTRQQRPHHMGLADRVATEDCEGIAMAPLHESLKCATVDIGKKVSTLKVHSEASRSLIAIWAKPSSGMGSHFGRFRAS